MRKWTVLLITMAFSFFANAQTSVTGVIVDQASKQTIEFASISLIHLPDSVVTKETTTDKKGRYTIDGVSAGDYLLRCSFIGFNKIQTASFKVQDGSNKQTLPVIELNSASKNLEDITVVGRKSLLNTSIDRKTYNVEQDIMSRAGSASDILKNIPSVEVDIEGNVSLRGSGDLIILINGKPSPLMGRTRAEVLQQLPANSIERIEVITNPSARYRPDGTSGIINIVLKKNIKNGFNGTATLNAGNHDRYNGNLLLNYKPKKFNLFGSYSFRHDSRRRFNALNRTYTDTITKAPVSYYNQNGYSTARPHAQIITGGIDYTMDEHNSLGISGTYFNREQTRNDISTTLRYDKLYQLTSNTDRLRYDPEYEKQKNGAFYFEHFFSKEDHSLRAEFNTSNEDEVEDNHYTNVFYFPSKPKSFDNTRISQGTYENQLTIDYSNPLTEDSKLEAGYDGLYNKVDLNFYGENFDASQNKFIRDAIKSNQFIYNETIHAFYITYQRGFEKWGYSLGLRSEAALTKGHLITKDSTITNDYFKVYPTVHLSYKLKENSELQLNYSKRVHRAEADELNPFPEYQDSLNLRAGNPKLKPEIIHSIEFGYKWQNKNFSFVPSLYYRYKINGFTSVVIPLNDSVLLSTTQNLSNDESAGLEMIFSGKAKFLSASLSANFFYNHIDASNLGYIRNKAIVSMTTNLNLNFTLSKSTMLQVSSNYRSPRLTPQGKTYGTFVMNAGLRQDLFKNKLSVTLTGSDLFNSLRQKNEYTIPSLYQESKNRRDGRIVFVGVSYRFGVIKKTKEEKLQFDNNL